jgi:hypothetical protein
MILEQLIFGREFERYTTFIRGGKFSVDKLRPVLKHRIRVLIEGKAHIYQLEYVTDNFSTSKTNAGWERAAGVCCLPFICHERVDDCPPKVIQQCGYGHIRRYLSTGIRLYLYSAGTVTSHTMTFEINLNVFMSQRSMKDVFHIVFAIFNI